MNADLRGKKLLILGAYSTEIEIINAARKMGIYTIVTDNHTDWTQAPAKYVADEAWDISWSDTYALTEMCRDHNVDGCMAGFSEKRIQCAKDLCSTMGYTFYADGADLATICDKLKFKDACIKSGVTVPKAYEYDDNIVYPVIVKPADNAGSRGITICHTKAELDEAYQQAMRNSDSGRILIEQYITADEVMVYYTVHNGQCTLSAMCDRIMQKFDRRITQLPIGYYYPSKHLSSFTQNCDAKFRKLIKNLGIRNGTIAFQSFALKDDFIPFDPTYRLDGTMTYHLTEHLNSSNVLKMMIRYSLTGNMGDDTEIIRIEKPDINKIGFQLPILLTQGKISSIVGMDEIAAMESVFFIHTGMQIGDVCDKYADFSQIFCRIHVCVDNENQLVEAIETIYNTVDVLDENGMSMVIGRLDTDKWKRTRMKVSIIGAGCVGSVIVERLLRQNIDLSIIALGKRGENLKSEGLTVNGVKYDVRIAEESDPAPDLLFVCVKNYDLEQSLKDIKDFIDSHTVILPLLNSVTPTPTIQGIYPDNHVLYGYIQKIDAYREGKGYKYNVAGDIHFGDAINDVSNLTLMSIKEMLSKAGFGAFIDQDMIRGIWKKWMLNVGANQISALTEADYLQFAQIPEIEQVLRLAMQELLIIAGYEGVNVSTVDVLEMIQYLTTYQFPKKTSMLQDVQARRKTEVDYISGDIIELSRKWNYPCPVNLTMYYLIKSKESAYLLNGKQSLRRI